MGIAVCESCFGDGGAKMTADYRSGQRSSPARAHCEARFPRLGASYGSEALKVGGNVGDVVGSRRGLLRPRVRRVSRITAAADIQLFLSVGVLATREKSGGRTMLVRVCVFIGFRGGTVSCEIAR